MSLTGRLDGGRLALTWQVSGEASLRGYTVQRSTNGRDFADLQEVKAAGKYQYDYADNIQQLTGRRLFYRLAMTNRDGSVKYSDIFSLHVPLNNLFTVYPNPVRDVLNITLAGPLKNSRLMVYDQAGRILMVRTVEQATGLVQVDTHALPNGTYTIRLQTADGNAMVQRFQVVK